MKTPKQKPRNRFDDLEDKIDQLQDQIALLKNQMDILINRPAQTPLIPSPPVNPKDLPTFPGPYKWPYENPGYPPATLYQPRWGIDPLGPFTSTCRRGC